MTGPTAAAQADGFGVGADIPVSGAASNEDGSMRRSRDYVSLPNPGTSRPTAILQLLLLLRNPRASDAIPWCVRRAMSRVVP